MTMALGLSIIYGVTRIFNFAHGLVAVIGAYFVWWFVSKAGLSLELGILISIGFMFSVGLFIYWTLVYPLLQKPKWEFTTIAVTLGLGISLENLALVLFGPDTKSIPRFLKGSMRVHDISIMTWHDFVCLLIVLVLLFALRFFLEKSRHGQAIRAVAQDMDGAAYIGIDIFKVFAYTFAIGFAVTGFSGVLLASKLFLTSSMGWDWMVRGFVIVVFAGLGSITGLLYAGLFLGITEAFVSLFLGVIWVPTFWLLAFLLILLFRPQGLSGAKL